MCELRIGLSESEGVQVLSLDGYVDARTVDELDNALKGLLDDGHCRLVVDSEKVSYISSHGISILLMYLTMARQNGGDILFVKPSSRFRLVLNATNLTHVFREFDDIDAALEFWRD